MPTILIVIILLLFAVIFTTVIILRHQNRRKVNETIKDKVVLKIAVPRYNEKSPLAAEQLFSSLHGMAASKKKSMDHFSLEIAAGSYGIHFIIVAERKYKTFIENQFYAQYPEAQISEISDYTDTFDNTFAYTVSEMGLTKETFLPIKTFVNFEVDPLAAVTSAVSKLEGLNEAFIQIVSRPIGDTWQKQGQEYINAQKAKKDGDGNSVAGESGEKDKLAQIERKNTKVGFQFKIRILTKSKDPTFAERLNNEITASFGQYKTGLFNSIGNPPALKGYDKFKKDFDKSIHQLIYGKTLGDKLTKIDKYRQRFIDEMEKNIVNIEELASLYHLPNKSVETPNISWAGSKKLEYPLNIPTENARILGVTDYRGVHIPFGIKSLDRLRHLYLIGKTGMGKSTLLEELIMDDIYDGQGVAYIDPHGDSIFKLLDQIPEHRKQDVVIFDPGDSEHPVGLNLLELKEGENKSLVADGLVSVFKKAFSDSWGPRLEYLLTNTILTLLHCQNVSLLAIPRILTDKNYREFLLKQVDDPVLLKFWNEEYAQMSRTAKDVADNTGSILNKIGRFTTNPLIRNMIGQVKSSIDFEDVMNNRGILLINLSQGKVGEENMALLGGMLITRIYSTTVRRVDIDKSQRVPFYLYVDEFQNFATSTFTKILSEARKFGLGLVVTHQYIDQLEEGIRHAIFGNVGTLMNFAVGPRDAEELVKEYTPYLTAEDLVNLERFGVAMKLSIDMAQSKPFTAKTLAPRFPVTNMRQDIIDTSRRNYSKPRDMVEQKIFKWASQEYTNKGNLIQKDAEGNVITPQGEAPQAPKPPFENKEFGNKEVKRFDDKKPKHKSKNKKDDKPHFDKPREDKNVTANPKPQNVVVEPAVVEQQPVAPVDPLPKATEQIQAEPNLDTTSGIIGYGGMTSGGGSVEGTSTPFGPK